MATPGTGRAEVGKPAVRGHIRRAIIVPGDAVRRFYDEVSIGAAERGWSVLLDGKPVLTPARRGLEVPTAALAEAVAAEWAAQGSEVSVDSMRLTKLATTAVDLMPERRSDAVSEAVGYAGTDLLCYRAAAPASLALRQAEAWQPWLDWAERQYDARLVPAAGVMPAEQDERALRALRSAVERLDDWRLVGLHAAVTATGSLVLGLAVERGVLTAEEAFGTALLDELFEIEQWGEDAEQSTRHARLRADLEAAERFLRLLDAG
jgi:chaperone required for assembly of F1-ATPase